MMELGAGVGLTGLVTSILCNAKSVHLTDFTDICLHNLTINIRSNAPLFELQNVDPRSVTCGYLEWRECAEEAATALVFQQPNSRMANLVDTDVLIAGDVCYDRNDIPHLVKVVRLILEMKQENDEVSSFTTAPDDSVRNKERYAIFATTYRNAATFQVFQEALVECNISCTFVETDMVNNLPKVFPCYFNQGREEVRITILKSCQ